MNPTSLNKSQPETASDVRVGQGSFQYKANAPWPRLPDGFSWPEVAGVACDSRGRVYVFNRGPNPMMIFQRDGTFISTWGAGIFTRAHGITIGPDDSIYCTDDLGHAVRKFTPEGKLLMTLGTPDRPSDTGATSMDFRTIRRAGPPFHYPTNVALGPDGELFVTDGYGNARVHRFTQEGRLIASWGEPGDGPGQFNIPHGIAVSQGGNVYVADRENSRIQIFSPDGNFLAEWRNIARPCEVAFDSAGHLFVAELGYRAGMWPGINPPSAEPPGGRVSVFSVEGKLLAQWGGGKTPTAPGDFFAPHDVFIDSHGDVYVSEVTYSAGGNRGLVAPDCHALQKFIKQ